jgi:hypothetical protein
MADFGGANKAPDELRCQDYFGFTADTFCDNGKQLVSVSEIQLWHCLIAILAY